MNLSMLKILQSMQSVFSKASRTCRNASTANVGLSKRFFHSNAFVFISQNCTLPLITLELHTVTDTINGTPRNYLIF